jgi:hypothetical protein
MGLTRDNRPHATVDLLSLDLLSKTVILPVECSFIEACQIKDCIPHGLAWNRATVDRHAADHSGAFDHCDTFSQLCCVDGGLLTRRTASNHYQIVKLISHVGIG